MSPRKFDRFMVDVNVGTNRKLRRLTPPERWCFLAGVLPIAAMSPIRGMLLIGDVPAEPHDYAEQSGVTTSAARAALRKLREIGVVLHDEDLGCERVHDFEDWNPAPKSDPTAAERMRRYRANRRNGLRRNGYAVAPGREEKGTEEHPPTPQGGDGRVAESSAELLADAPVAAADGNGGDEGGRVVTFARRPVPAARLELAERLLAAFNAEAGTSHPAFTGRGSASSSLQRIIGALTDRPDVDEAAWLSMVRWRFVVAPAFWDGKPDTGVAFGPNVVGSNLESAAAHGAVSGPEVEAERRRKILDGAA